MRDDRDDDGMDPQARRFLAMVGLSGAPAGPVAIEERRASFARLMRFSRAPDRQVAVEDTHATACGRALPLRLYAPAGLPAPSPGLVYFHGGGLVAGDLDTHDALCRTLACDAECRIVSVGYRLAPEHPFPAAILDAHAATRHVARHPDRFGLRAGALALGGDSGGATLAAVAAAAPGAAARLRALVLLCPVLDFAEARPSRRSFGEGYLLDAATMAADLAHVGPSRPLDDPHVSPLRSRRLASMPTTILHTAGFDPLRDEGVAYAERLRAAGVDVLHRDHPSLIHHFYGLAGAIPAARAALSGIGRDIRDALA